MSDSIHDIFLRSLTTEQKKDYRQRSINQQKDWYIQFLEKNFKTS